MDPIHVQLWPVARPVARHN